mmetsp:Transcript_25223/g.68321  ORF Transcript_25223/g.68321 Transcript_25223/m.68321 type:complete len:373 (+) Transcript_25223:71-1189(+)
MAARPSGVPIVDLSHFHESAHAASPADRASAAASLDAAATDVGFFYVSIPGLAEAGDRLLARCREVHALPQAEKDSVMSSKSTHHRGFSQTWKSGQGSCAMRPGEGPPDPKEAFVLGSEGEDLSPMHGPNQWPSEEVLPGWRDAVQEDRDVFLGAARAIARAMATALADRGTASASEDVFAEAMREPPASIVMLRYDPAWRSASGTSRVACGAHTDCGFFTLLVQEPGAAPLQVQRGMINAGVRDRAGAAVVDEDAWVDAPPLSGHILVNVGDLLSRWTNGKWRSTVHRVMLGSGSNGARHSVAFFANATYAAWVECLPSCCAPAPGMPPPQFEPITAGRYMSDRLGLMYDAQAAGDSVSESESARECECER